MIPLISKTVSLAAGTATVAIRAPHVSPNAHATRKGHATRSSGCSIIYPQFLTQASLSPSAPTPRAANVVQTIKPRNEQGSVGMFPPPSEYKANIDHAFAGDYYERYGNCPFDDLIVVRLHAQRCLKDQIDGNGGQEEWFGRVYGAIEISLLLQLGRVKISIVGYAWTVNDDDHGYG